MAAGRSVLGDRLLVTEDPDDELAVDNASLRRPPSFRRRSRCDRYPGGVRGFLVDDGDGVGGEELAVGEIALEPVEQMNVFVVPKRIDPHQLEEWPIAGAQLPAPQRPNVEFFVEIGRLFQQHFVGLGRLSAQHLNVDATTKATLLALHNRHLGDHDTLSTAAYRRLLDEVREALGPDEFARYIELHDAYFTTLLLR